jgi:diguanylate cyclase (GGDEF)-like protein
MGDDSRRFQPHKLKRDIYIAAGLKVVAFVVALFFIVNRARFVANGIALNGDFELLNAEIIQQRTKSEWTMNEATSMLDGLVTLNRRQPELTFMAEELKGWIANDYGLKQVLVVDSDGSIRFALKDGVDVDDPATIPVSRVAVGMAERARTYLEEIRPQLSEGWEYDNARENECAGYVLSDFVALDGQFGLVLAQVVVPWADDGVFMEGEGHVHVAFRPLDYGGLEAAVARLNLQGFRVSAIDDAPAQAARFDVTSLDGSPAFALLWDQPDPRKTILFAVLPLGVALCCAITALLAIMLRRYRMAISELAASEERNRRMANHDALTGLANRAQFDVRLDALIEQAPQRGFAVMCIDLDKFKAANDTHGHNAGDAVLIAAANRFADRVGGNGLVARVGGDEFIVLVTAGVEPGMLRLLGEQLIADATLPVTFEGIELQIGASIGVSVWPANGRSAKDIINAADQVLYDSKRAGRGRCTLADVTAGDEALIAAA